MRVLFDQYRLGNRATHALAASLADDPDLLVLGIDGTALDGTTVHVKSGKSERRSTWIWPPSSEVTDG